MRRMRFLGILLAAVCLLCSCGRTVVDEESGDTQTYSRWSEENTDLYSLTFPVECFTSLTNDELLARAMGGNERYCDMLSGLLDTPLCIYGSRINPSAGHTAYFVYDKRTGTFSDACRDPLCDHTSCLWGHLSAISYVIRGRDGLLFVDVQEDFGQSVDTDAYGAFYQFYQSTIYATDFQGNHVRKLYETVGSVEGLQQVGDYLWFDLVTWSDEKEEMQEEYVRLHVETGQAETVMRKGETPFGWIFPLKNGTQVFNEVVSEGAEGQSFFSIYLYDLETKEYTVFLEDPTGAHRYWISALLDNEIYYTDTVRVDKKDNIYRRADNGFGEETLVMEQKQSVRTVWAPNEVYRWETTDTGCIVYRENEEPYVVDVGYSVTGLTLDGDLLLCYYSVRENGLSGKHHWMMINLKTGEQLDFVIS